MSSPTECIDALIVRAIYTRFQKKQHDFRRPEIRLREEKEAYALSWRKHRAIPRCPPRMISTLNVAIRTRLAHGRLLY